MRGIARRAEAQTEGMWPTVRAGVLGFTQDRAGLRWGPVREIVR